MLMDIFKTPYADFIVEYPEFKTLSEDMYARLQKRAYMFVPVSVWTCNSRSCDLDVKKEILNLFIAHIIALYDYLSREAANNSGEPVSIATLQRTAQSLSEGGLSISYYDIAPTGQSPTTLYEWLTRTAYGDQAKILLERCLSGKRGVFTV